MPSLTIVSARFTLIICILLTALRTSAFAHERVQYQIAVPIDAVVPASEIDIIYHADCGVCLDGTRNIEPFSNSSVPVANFISRYTSADQSIIQRRIDDVASFAASRHSALRIIGIQYVLDCGRVVKSAASKALIHATSVLTLAGVKQVSILGVQSGSGHASDEKLNRYRCTGETLDPSTLATAPVASTRFVSTFNVVNAAGSPPIGLNASSSNIRIGQLFWGRIQHPIPDFRKRGALSALAVGVRSKMLVRGSQMKVDAADLSWLRDAGLNFSYNDGDVLIKADRLPWQLAFIQNLFAAHGVSLAASTFISNECDSAHAAVVRMTYALARKYKRAAAIRSLAEIPIRQYVACGTSSDEILSAYDSVAGSEGISAFGAVTEVTFAH